jgi:hypothetical protein
LEVAQLFADREDDSGIEPVAPTAPEIKAEVEETVSGD